MGRLDSAPGGAPDVEEGEGDEGYGSIEPSCHGQLPASPTSTVLLLLLAVVDGGEAAGGEGAGGPAPAVAIGSDWSSVRVGATGSSITDSAYDRGVAPDAAADATAAVVAATATEARVVIAATATDAGVVVAATATDAGVKRGAGVGVLTDSE